MRIRAVHEPDLDYDAWEARIAAGVEDRPGQTARHQTAA